MIYERTAAALEIFGAAVYTVTYPCHPRLL